MNLTSIYLCKVSNKVENRVLYKAWLRSGQVRKGFEVNLWGKFRASLPTVVVAPWARKRREDVLWFGLAFYTAFSPLQHDFLLLGSSGKNL